VERFESVGFDRNAFYCGYGLAEATLLVCDSERGRFPQVLALDKDALERGIVTQPREGKPITRCIGCGKPPVGTRIFIADSASLELCRPESIGEIFVFAESVAPGYWNNAAESTATFGVHLHGSVEEPLLRTGDIGFVHDNELFIVGRVKDTIIIRGRNIYPQDIETTVEGCHRVLRRGCTAVFAITGDPEDRMVVVQEVRAAASEELDQAVGIIRRRLMSDHDVVPHTVVLVEAGGVSKTSSGKLQRGANRTRYLTGKLPVVYQHVVKERPR
jgi:acyl-CoA synthetase (AMP-forming)/AMP-acid ligase II